MKSKRFMQVATIVGCIMFAISAAMCLYNINYFKYSFIFGDAVEEGLRVYVSLGIPFDYDIAELYRGYVNRGNMAFFTGCFSIVVLIAYVLCYSLSLKLKAIEQADEQTSILKKATQLTETIYCSRCGTLIEGGLNACSKCGTPLSEATNRSKANKFENAMKLPLIALVVLQVVSLILGLAIEKVGGLFLVISIATVIVIPIVSIIAIVKANKIQSKNGKLLGVITLCGYGFLAIIILLLAAIAIWAT